MSPCLYNLYAGHIIQNARLDELQAGIKTARRNINNFRCADDTTSWQKVKRTKEPPDDGERGVEKVCLKLNSQKTKITASGPITSWQIEEEN